MRLFEIILLVSLVVCAVSVGFARDLRHWHTSTG